MDHFCSDFVPFHAYLATRVDSTLGCVTLYYMLFNRATFSRTRPFCNLFFCILGNNAVRFLADPAPFRADLATTH